MLNYTATKNLPPSGIHSYIKKSSGITKFAPIVLRCSRRDTSAHQRRRSLSTRLPPKPSRDPRWRHRGATSAGTRDTVRRVRLPQCRQPADIDHFRCHRRANRTSGNHRTAQYNKCVRVIWHKAASPPRMDGSMVFARWRQSAPPSDTCFLWPTRVYFPNGISIGSAVSAQLTGRPWLTTATNRQTDRQTTLLRGTAMRPNNRNNNHHHNALW